MVRKTSPINRGSSSLDAKCPKAGCLQKRFYKNYDEYYCMHHGSFGGPVRRAQDSTDDVRLRKDIENINIWDVQD